MGLSEAGGRHPERRGPRAREFSGVAQEKGPHPEAPEDRQAQREDSYTGRVPLATTWAWSMPKQHRQQNFPKGQTMFYGGS